MNNDNLYAVLAAGFGAAADVAIETPRRSYSWRDVEEGSARYAHLLQRLGLRVGDRVLVQAEKSPESLLLYLGVLRAGMVYLPLNTAYREAEVAYFAEDAEPALMVCGPDQREWMRALADRTGAAHVLTLDADGEGSLAQEAAQLPGGFDTVARAADDLAAILYTSGTTGRSKGAMLSHGNLASNARVLHGYWGWRSDDVLLHMLPIFHVHGLFVAAHGALLAGARMIWLPKLDVEQAVHYLPRCTVMMGVPTYYVRLLDEARFDAGLCRNMRLFVSGSAPLLVETFETFRKRTGHVILERYGMSETVMLTSNPCHAEHGARIAGTVGRPLPGVRVRVVGDDGAGLPPGSIGHIQVQGPNVFSGYWRMPEKTREAFTMDGWFDTGDMGCWGEAEGQAGAIPAPDDYLSIVGRSKDLIISGGYNVYPKEVELAIDELPGVRESAVIGVPHRDFGEAVVAVVVPRTGATLDASALLARLKSCLAGFKLPKHVAVVDELPRNTMGKVQKNALREAYRDCLQDG